MLTKGVDNSVRNHALSLFDKPISGPFFVRLQTFPDCFPLLNCFLLPSHQISVSRKILKRSPGKSTKKRSRIQFITLEILSFICRTENCIVENSAYPLKSSIDEKLCTFMKSFSSVQSFLTKPYPCIITPVQTCNQNSMSYGRVNTNKTFNHLI